MPEIVRSVGELRARVARWRRAGERIALVPTMGALHEGHVALARAAHGGADRVVVSVFVNPTQFGPGEDFARYPRDEAADRAKLSGLADLVFAPDAAIMYPPGFATTVSVAGVSEGLEGAARPGHFAGVATVVAKLLVQAAPDVALFGEKDWQQLQVVRRMVADLDLAVEIVGHPIVRDADGLALSSRNAYLDAGQLAVARRLNRVLAEASRRIAEGVAAGSALAEARTELEVMGFGPIDYLVLADPETLAPADRLDPKRGARLLVAARLGPVRLLDNMPVPPGEGA